MEDKIIELQNRIVDRQRILKNASEELKTYFVGLDDVIDKIVSSIEAWYCMPDTLTRPTVVCLWGLTGNGKTDLVRRLVQLLDKADNFVEVQMTNKGSAQNTNVSTLQNLLSSSNVSPDEPGILLLDEIQRFRSINEDDKEIQDYAFQDIWMLLSDGCFGSASDNKQALMELLVEAEYSDDYNTAKSSVMTPKKQTAAEKKQSAQEEEIEKKRKFKASYWSSRYLKKRLRLTESVEEIMTWDSIKKVEMLQAKMKDKSIYRPEIYSKLLIFISGNLDEAYKMSKATNDSDHDADLFHSNSLKVNLLTIKGALRARFKPEQIARFGNNHVIYPALNKSNYQAIIQRRVESILEQIREKSDISFSVDQTVLDAIYRNGVFPAQGTRPVFSTISSFFESVLPTFTLKCLQTGIKRAKLEYREKCLLAKIGKHEMRVLNEGDIDKIKASKRNDNHVCLIAVHEAGHAVTYSKLFGLVPTQISTLTASEDTEGFIGIHEISGNRSHLIDKIAVLMAGRVAEEMAFGKTYISNGAFGDIKTATSTAAAFLRSYGMGTNLAVVTSGNNSHAHLSIVENDNDRKTNWEMEKMLREGKERALQILEADRELFVALVSHLRAHDKIESEEYLNLCSKHNLEVKILNPKEIVMQPLASFYEKFLERGKQNEEAKKLLGPSVIDPRDIINPNEQWGNN